MFITAGYYRTYTYGLAPPDDTTAARDDDLHLTTCTTRTPDYGLSDAGPGGAGR